jgi:hypothetical protein
VNLSKGRIGEDNSALLGAMIITRLQLAAMSRVDMPEAERRDFFLYVDEFQNFATDSFTNILSEARKYHLSLTLAHQYIGQLVNEMNTRVRDAVFGNVGTIISYRVGAADAEFLEKEFEPQFMMNDLVNLPKANVYIKLLIDGIASLPFSAEMLPPRAKPLESYADVIIKNSQQTYGTPRLVVEEKMAREWQSATDAPSQQTGSGSRNGNSNGNSYGAPSRASQPAPPPTARPAQPQAKSLSEALKPRVQEKEKEQTDAPPAQPRPPKKKVDISDLRKAISESLNRAREAAVEETDSNEKESQEDNSV